MEPKKSPLLEFMLKLSEDPALAEALASDPEGTLAATDLSDEAKAAVLAKSNSQVQAVVATELGLAGAHLVPTTISHITAGWT